MVKRILVIRGGGLGDFILIFPLLKALRLSYPNASIQVLGNREIAELALECGLADSLYSLASAEISKLFQKIEFDKLDSPFCQNLRSTDLIINFLGEKGDLFDKNLLSLAQSVIWIPAPTLRGTHAARHFLNCSGLKWTPEQNLRFRLRVTNTTQNQADSHFKRYFSSSNRVFAIHPGSGSKKKNWPITKFSETIEKLRSTGVDLLLVEGEADIGLIDQIEEKTGHKFPKVSHLPLPVLAGVLKRCQMLIGNDSGIGHLAGITGIPVLSLFGPTDPTIWKPLGRNIEVMRFQDATVDRVCRKALILRLETGNPEV